MGEPALKIEEKKTYRINGVEIFSAGTWNGKEHTIADLYAMCDSFSALKPGWIPSLKLGHDDSQKVAKSSGLPSVGWVDRVYVLGDKLMADFENIPDKVFQLIKKKAYRKVSCEIYYGIKFGESTFSHVLGAVAFLGAELPGVMNLNDILDQYSHLSTGEVFAILEKQDTFNQYSRTFEMNHTEETQMSKTENELALEAQLAEQATKFSSLEAEKAALETEKVELMKFKADAEAATVKAELAQKEAELKQFVLELKSKKLVTVATEPMVQDLLSDKVEFTVGEEKLTKGQLIEKLLTLTQASGNINFDESLFAKKDDGDGDDDAKDQKAVDKFMKDNPKCSAQEAYKAVMKSKLAKK